MHSLDGQTARPFKNKTCHSGKENPCVIMYIYIDAAWNMFQNLDFLFHPAMFVDQRA